MALLVLCGACWAGPWIQDGRPAPEAHEALQLLEAAGSHGLEPRDYGADALRGTLQRLEQGASIDAQAGDHFERALDTTLQRYLRELHAGRVDPATLYPGWKHPALDAFDPAAVLAAALARHRLQDAVDAAAPPLPQYQRLREALERYRALESHPAWAQPLPPLPVRPRGKSRSVLEPGQAWNGLPLLAQRLRALGDLPGSDVRLRYEGALVEVVRSFQRRHGLHADLKGGQVHFFDDLYGHDRVLDAALRNRPVQPLPEPAR